MPTKKITAKEIALFNNLRTEKQEDIAVLSKNSYKGIWGSVIDKYPESAHFIYELLQNADDAEATNVKIQLAPNYLLFKHNGRVQFSVTERDANPIGHINSITSIGDSTKNDIGGNKIGKFGVGFKSVFQYTKRPEIYDDKFHFRLVDYIVPEMIQNDHPQRNEGETLFYFPFFEPPKAYKEILDRLNTLDNPILFLRHLERVEWHEISNKNKKIAYCKKVNYKKRKDGISCELIEITNNNKMRKLYMFTSEIDLNHYGIHTISLGYYLTKNGDIDTQQRPNIFCFFPTSQSFNLCFICHAPFLLVDSRQQMKENEAINKELVDSLAQLQAKSLLLLRDIGIENQHLLITNNLLSIVPLKNDLYSCYAPKLTSIHPFYIECQKNIRENALLLSANSKYLTVEEALTCIPVKLMGILNKKQLNVLVKKNGKTNFVIDKISAKYSQDYEVEAYFDELEIECFTTIKLGELITENFMQEQPIKWVVKLYGFLQNDAISLWKHNKSEKQKQSTKELLFRHSPIIKTTTGQWVSSDTTSGALNVYLPLNTTTNEYNIVHNELIRNENAKTFLLELGLKQPDEGDYIKTKIIEKYANDEIHDIEQIDNDFEKIYLYCNNLNQNDRKTFLEVVKNKYKLIDIDGYLIPPSSLYDKTIKELYQMIRHKEEVSFIDYEKYKQSIKKHGEENIRAFLYELGVRTTPEIIERECNSRWKLSDRLRKQIQIYDYTAEKITDYVLAGFQEYIENEQTISLKVSIWLWNHLSSININQYKELEYCWKYRTCYKKSLDSTLIDSLKNSNWLTSKRVSPSETTQEELLAEKYTHSTELFRLLGIPSKKSLKEIGATEDQIRREEMGLVLEKEGLSFDDIPKMIELYKEQNTKSSSRRLNIPQRLNNKGKNQNSKSNCDINPSDINFLERKEVSKKSLKDMFVVIDPMKAKGANSENKAKEDNIEEVTNKLKKEAEKRSKVFELREVADQSVRYSKKWFESLLELEYQGSNEEISSFSKALTISFSLVTRESGPNNIYTLSNPSRFIPMWIEDIGNLSIKFQFYNCDETEFKFDVANVRDFTVRLKAKTNDAQILSQIDWGQCSKATFNVDNPIKLVARWRDSFKSLNLPSDFNLKEHLKDNISFVFGPPGTGKTTYLAKYISRKMKERQEFKILVLAPTNKACDVLAKKLISENMVDHSWLARFVVTGDQVIEDADALCDRSSEIWNNSKCCIISTMSRLSFDGFLGALGNKPLKNISWNCIICDEASMIPLVQIVFAIYKFENIPFIISGDPFQISPIVRESQWENENIYKMIKLDRFNNPKTEPIQFEIENLDKQYRSLPVIGELFSQYAYEGKLRHHRSASLSKEIRIPELNLKPITYVSFKVERFDSIFGVKKVGGSNVHVYSALLTVEFIKYIANEYKENNTKDFHVGIICPYAAQAQFIEKLVEQIEVPQNIYISIGTIHRFQGDECDLVLVVFNPPSGIKGNPNKIFLNNKNIINVAISRAKDCLCILLPHSDSEGYDRLYEINNLGRISMNQNQGLVQIYTCDELEKIIFGKPFFIENNTFVTSHQQANIYTKASIKYEIRIDENHIDIQVD